MMAEPRSVPNVTVGAWKSGSKEKRDCPHFQLCYQNRFHILELSKKSVEKLEIYLCRLLAFLNGDWLSPWTWLGWTFSWFRDKKIDALSHTLTLIWQHQTLPTTQHALLFDIRNAVLTRAGLPWWVLTDKLWWISRLADFSAHLLEILTLSLPSVLSPAGKTCQQLQWGLWQLSSPSH